MRYRWEPCHNNEIRKLHVGVVLPDMFAGNGRSGTYDEAVRTLADDLLAVPGVVRLWTTRYRIDLLRSPIYSWEEIEPAVLDVVRRRLANGEPLEEIAAS